MRWLAGILAISACSTPIEPLPIARSPVPPPVIAPRIVLDVAAEQAYRGLADHDDPRLTAVATDLARYVDAGGLATTAVTEQLLRLHGIVDSVQHVATAATQDELDTLFLDEKNHTNAQIASAPTQHGVVGLVVFAAPVTVTSIPRAGDHFDLAGTYADGMSSPRITIDGKDKLHVDLEDHTWRSALECKQDGEHSVAIEVTDPKRDFMPTIIFPVYCHVDAPKVIAGEPRTNIEVSPDRVTAQFVAILDRERATAKLPAFYWNNRLASASATFLKDRSERRMTAANYHLRKAGLISPQTNLVAFHVDSLASGVSRILDDATQRDKLLDSHYTDLGITVKPDSDGYWMSIGYVAVPPIVDPIALKAKLEKQIIDLTIDRYAVQPDGGTELKIRTNKMMQDVARNMAKSIALGWSSDSIAKETRRTYGFLDLSINSVADLSTFDLASILKKHEFQRFGVGVAQAAQDGPLAGMIYIVIAFGPFN
ncbi:MAG: hypothetical protein QM831_13465 [Kofleriaceae bacterium]